MLQGTQFETDGTLQRVGNLMVDWFRGTAATSIRLQGLELIISLTAKSEDEIAFRVYKYFHFFKYFKITKYYN